MNCFQHWKFYSFYRLQHKSMSGIVLVCIKIDHWNMETSQETPCTLDRLMNELFPHSRKCIIQRT